MMTAITVIFALAATALSATTLPDLPIQDHNGNRTRFHQLTQGRVVVVQFVFTDCPVACPLLGALFQGVQKRLLDLPSDRGPLLLTVTVNPQRDTPGRLATWRNRFSGGPRWYALRLTAENLRTLQEQLGDQGGPPSAHTTDLLLFDKTGTLVRRLNGLPSADQVAKALRELE
jgi:protein SCO1/2